MKKNDDETEREARSFVEDCHAVGGCAACDTVIETDAPTPLYALALTERKAVAHG